MDPVTSRQSARANAALPMEAPLAMPRQSLRGGQRPGRRPTTAPHVVSLRRAVIFGATAASTLAAAWQMYQVLKVGGLTPLEFLVLILFVLLFAWIALSFVSTLAGLAAFLLQDRTLDIDPTAPVPELGERTALLLPTYNEDPHRITTRVQAIYESLSETGQLAHFDFFILSDTTDPAVWIAEEIAFLRLRRELGADRLFYRHRAKNIARKAGNIEEWITRFGGAYAHMIVLDADSLMEGDTIVRLAAAMERHPDVGLIQTLPRLLNGRTLFARLQQFAGSVYGPLIAYGIAWWHGAEGNYWGHNAIIRVAAFASAAALPQLKGGRVFGGHILSHDFVEAALLRRAGWGVHMAPQLGGSYEESPPTLTDYAIRDRRWCQGNLQHAGVLHARGLHWVSRLHLLTGIGSYITAPLWFAFLLAGVLISLQAEFIRPEYFPSGATLFPRWPAQDPVRAAYVFAGTMALLVVPKLIGWAAMLARRDTRNGMGGMLGGLLSTLTEIVISALIAPVMMLKQCRAVAEIVLGRDAGWSAQRRDDGGLSKAEVVRQYSMTTVLGLVFAAIAYAISAPLLIWMLPVVVGLILAIPIAWLTGRTATGQRLRALGLLLTPEECTPPRVLQRANELAARPHAAVGHPLMLLKQDRELREAHMQMVGTPPRRRKGDIDVHLVMAQAKIDDAETLAEAVDLLAPRELFALLSHRPALQRLLDKPAAPLETPATAMRETA
jgi:membrane glycosyltransferase